MSEEEQEAVDNYRKRTNMPPPPVFDTLEMVFHVINEEDEVEQLRMSVDMDRFKQMKKDDDYFSFVPINEAGKQVVKELVVI